MAQELVARGFALRYFDKSRYGEVDFVLPSRDAALLVEVKSGADYRRHKALDNVFAVGEWGIDRSIVLCPHNVEHAEKSPYLPWYMVMFLHPGI